MSEVFSGLWSLEEYQDIDVTEYLAGKDMSDLSGCQRALVNALKNPHDYVLKPQKEGGGNNFYDDEAKELLLKFIAADDEGKKPYR